MSLFNKTLSHFFRFKKVVKIIAGLNNNDVNAIIKLLKCIELTNATYVDIIANTKIICILKSITNIPICVSSIDPMELYNCMLCGADILEIGNFDTFYEKNLVLSYMDIFNISQHTRKLIPNKDICVTIPHYLNLSQQVNLAKDLEKIGINIIQTEGYSSKLDKYPFVKSLDNLSLSMYKSSSSLSSTYAISKAVNIPVITSSGINCLSSSIPILYGASGIGVGTSITQYSNIFKMYVYIQEIVYSISLQSNHLLINPQIDCYQIKKVIFTVSDS